MINKGSAYATFFAKLRAGLALLQELLSDWDGPRFAVVEVADSPVRVE